MAYMCLYAYGECDACGFCYNKKEEDNEDVDTEL